MRLLNSLREALLMMLVFAVLLGFVYPIIIIGVTHFAFPWQANGSLIVKNKQVIGSRLIGQNFSQPYYFHSRPSMAGKGYDAMASSGSNLGPFSETRFVLLAKRIASVKQQNPMAGQPIPIDLITASGSGLDPDISPASAFYQAPRVAKARNLTINQVKELINKHIEKRTFGVLGESRVNVLELNLALDDLRSRKKGE